jgi:hypothetical protein
MGMSVNDIHLCKNLRLGLWISLNLSLAYFSEIASLNSTLLKFLITLGSYKQDLEKSKSSLKQEKSQPNDFPNRRNFTNDFLFFSTVSKVIKNSRVRNACWRFVCNSVSTRNCQCSTSLGVFSRYCIYIFLRKEWSLSCLRLTQGVTPTSTTRLYRGYVNWG